MRKDIQIPEVKQVYMAALLEHNLDFNANNWYIYLINDTDKVLEMPLIVSRAYGTVNKEQVKTSTLRHSFQELQPYTALKIEFVEDQVFPLYNEFMVTYFVGNQMFDKKYVFQPNSINTNAMTLLPVIERLGVLIK